MTTPATIYLKNYTPPDFLIEQVFLYFDLHQSETTVRSVLDIKRNPAAKNQTAALVLNGEELILQRIAINGKEIQSTQYKVENDTLTITQVPDQFKLEIEVIIYPDKNTELAGLYQSSGNYCTQCESQGFRRITYFLDRPDAMSRFTTCIAADKDRYPTLLSNGNLVETQELADNRHWVKWVDPTLKPCYLFALVAGDFDCVTDEITTLSKRKIDLKVFVEKGKHDQAIFAMEALKRAMRWDEEAFGREYELDTYMIVSVSDFNFGAMENKGLNIFNDRYILAKPQTATDDDFIDIEGVIGHEYFHNWSGNRVTVRDWFQITLKEGLTIFRDQSFTADMNSPVVERISEVEVIRTSQFAQDGGPLAHPIRPESYIEINNFYTVTVYNKGAEVIRMIQTIIGKEKFRQGMDLYFDRNDGKAVTTDDFVQAMEDASGIDLTQFRLWYSQAGTPTLDVVSHYDANKKTYTIEVKQTTAATPGQAQKQAFLIPLVVGLLDATGKDLPLQLDNKTATSNVLLIKGDQEKFVFENISAPPVPSLLRNFSAPVKLNYAYTDDELIFLLTHDSDGFNRWDAGQKLGVKIMLQLIKDYRAGKKLSLPDNYKRAFVDLLQDHTTDRALMALMLDLPDIDYLIQLMPVADIEAICEVYDFMFVALAEHCKELLLENYHRYHSTKPYHFDGAAVAARSFKNQCLSYLAELQLPETFALCMQQFNTADNMTDTMGVLRALNDVESRERDDVLAHFYEKFKREDLVVDKWFSLQAYAELPNALVKVKQLLHHPAFNYKNPNKVRAVMGSFAHYNYRNFHAIDGSGYEFLADQVLHVDKINPQVASRILEPLTHWQKFDIKRQNLMKQQLEKIVKSPKLSNDVFEIASKSLDV